MKIKMNKKGLESRYLILGIIAIAVVGITIVAFLPQISRLLAFFGKSYDDLTASEKSNMEANFNQLVEDIKACRNIDDYECLCEGKMPTFIPKVEIEMHKLEDKKINLTLIYKEHKEAVTIDSLNLDRYTLFKCDLYEKKGEIGLIYEDLARKPIKFDEKYGIYAPHIENYFLFSTPLWKLGQREISLTAFGGPLIAVKREESMEYATEILAKMPKCLPKRQEAMQDFKIFIRDIGKEENYGKDSVIKLSQDYNIHYKERTFTLEYKKEPVIRLSEKTMPPTPTKIEEVSKKLDFDVRCAGQEWGHLQGGDKIKITKTAEGFCMEKL